MILKFKLHRYYKARNGSRVELTGYLENNNYSFYSGSHTYKVNSGGLINENGVVDEWDIVSEWDEEKDNINPNHYRQGKLETIDNLENIMTEEQFEGFIIGNVIKYISRCKHKNGIEDINKAIWYAEKLKETFTDEK